MKHQNEDLHQLIANKKNDLLEKLLKQGVDPDQLDKQNKSGIHIALEVQNFEAIKLLINAGANPNKGSFSTSFIKSYSALDLATGSIEEIPLQFEAAKLLIHAGATHGGIRKHALTPQQFSELNFDREAYIHEGEKCVTSLKQEFKEGRITIPKFFEALSKQTIGNGALAKDVLKGMNENYKLLELDQQNIIVEDLNIISSILHNTSHSFGVMDSIKSLAGYRYHEPSPTKEVHSLVRKIVLLLETANQSSSDEIIENNHSPLIGIVEDSKDI